MRVALVGAGALGSVYGARLAAAGCAVDVVARSPGPPREVRLERIGGREPLSWRAPAATPRASRDAEIVLVSVPYGALDDAFDRASEGAAPVVALTPMLPQDHARLSAKLPGRVVVSMPSVVAYENSAGIVRYWLPRGVATLIERRSGGGVEAGEGRLAQRLSRAGIEARLEADVLARNVATTVSFMPLPMAIDAAGGIDAALKDAALLELALRAAEEARELGRLLGKAEPWASTFLRFARPFLIRAGVALARARAPEALAYVDEHFGRKLHAQNVALGGGIVDLAIQRGARRASLEGLLARVKRG
jgi:ketopantoate reductase